MFCVLWILLKEICSLLVVVVAVVAAVVVVFA